MTLIADVLAQDHRDCDHAFARAEALVAKREWSAADKATAEFAADLDRHFETEEQVLFPRFEAVTGMSNGPTAVMRGEHAEMRRVLAELQNALRRRDADDFSGEAETLLILMQQHNMKEENILYPMCDARLVLERDTLIATISGQLAHEAST
ncbi:MAG: hemerythrin domain-containing protein [Thauera sp.]|nr:hemerythrin domain-containing protein [Thauera sp.]